MSSELSEEELNNPTPASIPSDLVTINSVKRKFIFFILFVISIVSSFDGGIIPQATTTMSHQWEKDDLYVGYYSSVDYLGRVFGSLLLTKILDKYNRKLLIIYSLYFKGVCLCVSIITGNFYVNIFLRFLSGFSQVFYTTYFPVWADQFAVKKVRTIWVMLIQLGNPLGIILGYGLSTILFVCGLGCHNTTTTTISCKYGEWRVAFFFEGGILILIGSVVWKFEDIYFHKDFKLKGIGNEGILVKAEKKQENFCKNFFHILCHSIFLFTTLSNSVAFFGMGVIQFWGNNYLKHYMKVEKSIELFIFNVICVTGPTIGVAVGGFLTQKLGGYTKRKAIYFALFLSLISSIISLFISKINSDHIVLFCSLVWLYLFFLCAMMPPESGIILTSLPLEYKGDGYTVTNFLLNLIGSTPCTFVYPFFKDIVYKDYIDDYFNHGENWPKAMFACMCYNFVGLFFILISTFFRMKLPEDLSQSTVLQKSLITGEKNKNSNVEQDSSNELRSAKSEEEEKEKEEENKNEEEENKNEVEIKKEENKTEEENSKEVKESKKENV